MTLLEIIGAIALAIVLLAGILIKTYTRRKLRDMDGVGGPAIATKKDADHIINMK